MKKNISKKFSAVINPDLLLIQIEEAVSKVNIQIINLRKPDCRQAGSVESAFICGLFLYKFTFETNSIYL